MRTSLGWAALMCWVVACGAQAGSPATRNVDPQDVLPPPTLVPPQHATALWTDASQIFESRCVVCHGCYDAPCQLKLGSYEGIRRGATRALVYDPARLTAAAPTRLGIDAHDVADWRERGFQPIVPEGDQRDPTRSVLRRMLELKRNHRTQSTELDADLTFALDREQTCATTDTFDEFAEVHPAWGMPYGLPALSEAEHGQLVRWIDAGAPSTEPGPLSEALQREVMRWEAFFNDPSLKARLAARYIYEHLFLSSLSFDDVDAIAVFRMVRSRTASPEPVDEIATRRPYDDPGSDPFYYRFVLQLEPRLAKTHMPYALNAQRMELYRRLFVDADYTVTALASYAPEVASNPLQAFAAIPVSSRYRFLLAEAQHTMMTFIKGPVCRGQVALNVIQERFWVMFVDPDSAWGMQTDGLVSASMDDLALPAEAGSDSTAIDWFDLARQHDRYVQRKNQLLKTLVSTEPGITPELIWDGDGDNENAALTVLRHFDSASIIQGFAGDPPTTTWVVDYPLLERIHYLLVAGFDVFGNVGHQVSTRMYMDFLRMEGEHNYLAFLPIKRRAALIKAWYRELSTQAALSVDYTLGTFSEEPSIRYRSDVPDHELLELVRTRLANVINRRTDLVSIQQASVRESLARLAQVPASAATQWPEHSIVTIVQDDGTQTHATVFRDSAHTNISELFREDDRRVPTEDRLTVLRGFVGAYPNALFRVQLSKLDEFVTAAESTLNEAAWEQLHRRYGVLRTTPDFWQHSDRLHAAYRDLVPHEAGLFDYSRLIGR